MMLFKRFVKVCRNQVPLKHMTIFRPFPPEGEARALILRLIQSRRPIYALLLHAHDERQLPANNYQCKNFCEFCCKLRQTLEVERATEIIEWERCETGAGKLFDVAPPSVD